MEISIKTGLRPGNILLNYGMNGKDKEGDSLRLINSLHNCILFKTLHIWITVYGGVCK